MELNVRTSIAKHIQGLLTVLSVVVALCASTPIPPHESLHPRLHYDRLVSHAKALKEFHGTVYEAFRSVRHNDPEIRLDDFRIEGVPSVRDLPTALQRIDMEESDLLPMYFARFRAFRQTIAQAIVDEVALEMEGDNDFRQRLQDILVLLQRVVSKLEQTMLRLNVSYDYDTLPTINFSDSTSNTYLSIRILFALQELNDNLRPAVVDFSMLRERHQVPAS